MVRTGEFVENMSKRAGTYLPVVILGAGRSGTNMLRDALTKMPQISTWDCDEINPVWRYGLPMASSDEFGPSALTKRAQGVIDGAFDRVAKNNPGTQFVVEKTCANSLRPGFVDAAVPDCVFVQIVRDGRDVTPSAAKRWRGELEVDPRSYFLAKARNTPLMALPAYGWQFLTTRWRKLRGKSDQLGVWGPRYDGLEADMSRPLDEICALQWAKCVDRTDEYLGQLPPERWLRLRYEDLVANPSEQIVRVFEFLGVPVGQGEVAHSVSDIRTSSGPRTPRPMEPSDATRLMPIMAATLERHGYLESKI